MAYWQRTSSGRVKVYLTDGTYLPKRGLYEHLDNEPDHNVDSWVKDWAARSGNTTQDKTTPPIDSYWADLITGYIHTMVNGRRKKSPKTASDHRKALAELIIPYFTQACNRSNPNDWPMVADQFLAWAEGRGVSVHKILKANSALYGFWEYLRTKQKILQGLGIEMMVPALSEEQTPLPRAVRPDEVLAYVAAVDQMFVPVGLTVSLAQLRQELKLMALLGYFFSLRPQETFALRRCDFVAGSKASEILACTVMQNHHLLLAPTQKLYGRLAVDIQRQRTQSGKFRTPKAYSAGWVACFDERAARLLAPLLMQFKSDEPLFQHLPDRQFKWWGRYGIRADGETLWDESKTKISLKDLRRASILWLGHFTSLSLVPLMGHARHKKEDTTRRYLRRPGERPDGDNILDLDA
jgi:integrase